MRCAGSPTTSRPPCRWIELREILAEYRDAFSATRVTRRRQS